MSVDLIDYDKETHELVVRFDSGNAYRFYGVAERFAKELRANKDKPRYVRQKLMSRYEFVRDHVASA